MPLTQFVSHAITGSCWILPVVSRNGTLFVHEEIHRFDLWPTVFGMALVYCGKLWYLDRRVWIREEYDGGIRRVPGMDVVPNPVNSFAGE